MLHSICIKEFETMGAVMDTSGTEQIIYVKVRSTIEILSYNSFSISM